MHVPLSLYVLYSGSPGLLSNSYGHPAPNSRAVRPWFVQPWATTRTDNLKSLTHMTILLLLLGVGLFGALAGYVIFCDRV
jgi:hypothetical protein